VYERIGGNYLREGNYCFDLSLHGVFNTGGVINSGRDINTVFTVCTSTLIFTDAQTNTFLFLRFESALGLGAIP